MHHEIPENSIVLKNCDYAFFRCDSPLNGIHVKFSNHQCCLIIASKSRATLKSHLPSPYQAPRPHASGYFLKRFFFIRIENISIQMRSVFENIPVHTKTLLFKLLCLNFDKRKQTIKMPLRDPQRSVRMLWYMVNRCCDLSVFKKFHFHLST